MKFICAKDNGMQAGKPSPFFNHRVMTRKPNPLEIVLASAGFDGKLCGSLLNFYGTHL
jgi:hypothetical protein